MAGIIRPGNLTPRRIQKSIVQMVSNLIKHLKKKRKKPR